MRAGEFPAPAGPENVRVVRLRGDVPGACVMSPARRTKVVAVIEDLVDENPGITARRLAHLLGEMGLNGYDKSDVNRVLYGLRPAVEVRSSRDGPGWFAVPRARESEAPFPTNHRMTRHVQTRAQQEWADGRISPDVGGSDFRALAGCYPQPRPTKSESRG